MPPSPDELRAALEQALLETPDDTAAWMAYADHLTEQGDPARGELVQVQFALEDEALTEERRQALLAREAELFAQNERRWLGELAPALMDGNVDDIAHDWFVDSQEYRRRWRRGRLETVSVRAFSRQFAHLLRQSSATRLLHELRIAQDLALADSAERDPPAALVPKPRGAEHHLNLNELIGAPWLDGLRVLRIGDEGSTDDGWADCRTALTDVEHFLAALPRLEELYLLAKGYDLHRIFGLSNLTHLRVLQVEHLTDYPLRALASNPAFANLTHLWLHPHFSDAEEFEGSPLGYLPIDQLRALVRSPHLKKLQNLRYRLSSAGDDGVRLLITSGFLSQLRVLDLRHGCVTDEGARLLAECPDTRNLELLELSWNQLTDAGVAALQGLGINVRCVQQHPAGSTEYLNEGDFE